MAKLLHVQRDTVYTWKHRGRLPEPDMVLSGRPAWWRETIVAWAQETGRWPQTANGT